MSLEQVDELRALLMARRGAAVPPTLEQRRQGFEAQMTTAPMPAGATVTPGGAAMPVAGAWVDAPGGDRDRVVLWLHGGAFVLGSSASYAAFGARIAAAAGCRVFLPDYRLAPEHPFPAALDDATAVLDALMVSHSAVVVGGDSAGGNLAVAAVRTRLSHGLPAPAGVWLISPYLDLLHSGRGIAERARSDPFVDPATMPATAAAYLAGHDPADPRASPLYGPVAGFPPALIQVGSDEALFDDAARLAARLDAESAGAVFQEWVGMIHVWPLFAHLIDEGQWAIAQGGAFVRRQLFQP